MGEQHLGLVFVCLHTPPGKEAYASHYFFWHTPPDKEAYARHRCRFPLFIPRRGQSIRSSTVQLSSLVTCLACERSPQDSHLPHHRGQHPQESSPEVGRRGSIKKRAVWRRNRTRKLLVRRIPVYKCSLMEMRLHYISREPEKLKGYISPSHLHSETR